MAFKWIHVQYNRIPRIGCLVQYLSYPRTITSRNAVVVIQYIIQKIQFRSKFNKIYIHWRSPLFSDFTVSLSSNKRVTKYPCSFCCLMEKGLAGKFPINTWLHSRCIQTGYECYIPPFHRNIHPNSSNKRVTNLLFFKGKNDIPHPRSDVSGKGFQLRAY